MKTNTAHKLEYRIAIGLLLYLTLRSFWWLALDVGVRLDLWPTGNSGFDAYAFTDSQTTLNVILFYIWVLTKPVSIWLLVAKRRLVIAVHIIGFAVSLADWVLLSLNDYRFISSAAAISFSIQTLILVILIRLTMRRFLT
jgi:hypothetical protein